jgi:putative FmdB family regulatory protein
MPTYHYKCKACDHEFEEFQGMSEDPLVKCPSCGKKKLVRLISGAGLVFKGSGFYLTDYKNRGSSAAGSPKEHPSSSDKPASEPAPAAEGGKEKGKGKGKEKPSSGPTPPEKA